MESRETGSVIQFFLNPDGNTIIRSVAGCEKGCRAVVAQVRVEELWRNHPCLYEWLKALNTAMQRGLYGHTIGEVKRPYHCLRAHSQTGMGISTSTLSHYARIRSNANTSSSVPYEYHAS